MLSTIGQKKRRLVGFLKNDPSASSRTCQRNSSITIDPSDRCSLIAAPAGKSCHEFQAEDLEVWRFARSDFDFASMRMPFGTAILDRAYR